MYIVAQKVKACQHSTFRVRRPWQGPLAWDMGAVQGVLLCSFKAPIKLCRICLGPAASRVPPQTFLSNSVIATCIPLQKGFDRAVVCRI